MSTKAIISILMNTPAVTALVGGRIQPNIIKQDTVFPAVYVSTDRMEPLACFSGRGVRMGQVEIGVYANSYAECFGILQAIRAALDDYNGTVAGVGVNIRRGQQVADQFDDTDKMHVMVLEYEAITQG